MTDPTLAPSISRVTLALPLPRWLSESEPPLAMPPPAPSPPALPKSTELSCPSTPLLFICTGSVPGIGDAG